VGYRGDLEAALARVAQLEAEIAALRGQLEATPAMQAHLSDLQSRRTAAQARFRDAERSARVSLTIAIAVVLTGAVAFVGTIAAMPSGHPLNATLLSLVVGAPIVAYFAWAGSERRTSSMEAVDALDREIAAPLQPARMARIATPAIRVAEELEEEPAPTTSTDKSAGT
jgi:hypothetical protein